MRSKPTQSNCRASERRTVCHMQSQSITPMIRRVLNDLPRTGQFVILGSGEAASLLNRVCWSDDRDKKLLGRIARCLRTVVMARVFTFHLSERRAASY